MGSLITSFSKLGVTLLDSLPEITRGANKVAKKITLNGNNKGVRALLPHAKEPLADVGYVVRDGYSVMAVRLRDGKKVLNQGVFSTTSNGNVIKYKMRLGENGANLSTNGFYDRGAKFDSKHWKFSGERDGEMYDLTARSNGKFANYTTVSHDFLKEFYHNLKSLGGGYVGLVKNGMKQLV